jgi:hypothetical protein
MDSSAPWEEGPSGNVLCVFDSRGFEQLPPSLVDLLHPHLILCRIRVCISRGIPCTERAPEGRGRLLLNRMAGLV